MPKGEMKGWWCLVSWDDYGELKVIEAMDQETHGNKFEELIED
jgi:hypothetical protein